MQLTCPCCHARNSFETFSQDEAAREFNALVLQSFALGAALGTYLGFFRSKSRALAWDRALKLTREVLELSTNHEALTAALAETCASLAAKRAEPSWKPLTGHNYLKRVLESVSGRVERIVDNGAGAARAPQSKIGQGLAALEQKKHGR